MTTPRSITTAMVTMRYHAIRSNCRVTAWRLTEFEASELAEEIRWMTLKPSTQTNRQMVDAMKRGEISVLGVPIRIKPPPPRATVDSSAWTGL